MLGGRRPSTRYLVIRSLLPSDVSGTLCFCFSVAIIGIHLLLLSLSAGTSLPKLFDGQWGLLYTNYVVGPADRFLNSFVVSNLVTIVVWGIIGLVVYGLGEYVVELVSDWWHAEHDVGVAGAGRYVYHPGRKMFILTVLWRLTVLFLAVSGFVLVQPLVQTALKAGPDIILGTVNLSHALRQLGVMLLVWVLVAHCFVVFWRLFLMRTRLFGDIAIE